GGLRPRARVRLLPRPRHRRPGPDARDRPHPRSARVRPDRHPGPPLPAGPLRRPGADRLRPGPDRADPRLPGCRQPAAAAAGDPGQAGGDARPAQRRPLRARPRRRGVPGRGPGHGRAGSGTEGGARRAAGGRAHHPRLLERPAAAARRRDLPGDRRPAGAAAGARDRPLVGCHRPPRPPPDRRAGRRLGAVDVLRAPGRRCEIERDHRRGGPRGRARAVRRPPDLQHRRRCGAGRRSGVERRRPGDRRAAGPLGRRPDAPGRRPRLLDVRPLGRADGAAAADVHRGDRPGGEGAGSGDPGGSRPAADSL
ncbi:MAG: hypothetical protein AVDCRST_MAG59-1408, partial [uncultured Thermomicrobiales bacterium]